MMLTSPLATQRSKRMEATTSVLKSPCCELLIERAAPSCPALAGNLLSVLAKVQNVELDRRQRDGELLGREQLFKVGQAICRALVERLSSLPNFEQVVDLILPAITETIKTAGREQQREPLRLTHQETAP